MNRIKLVEYKLSGKINLLEDYITYKLKFVSFDCEGWTLGILFNCDSGFYE